MSETPAERRHRERMEINDVLTRSQARTSFALLEATNLPVDELWQRTGHVRCADCRHIVYAETLASLPEHRCTERQQPRPA